MAKEANNKKKEISKDKKNYVKEFKTELKKVSWPSLKQLVNNTSAVIVIVLITAAIVFVLDVAFETINKYGVDKLKAVVTSNSSENVEDETVESNPNIELTTEEETEATTEDSKESETTTENAEIESDSSVETITDEKSKEDR